MKSIGLARFPSFLMMVMLIFPLAMPANRQAVETQSYTFVENFQNYNSLDTLSSTEWDIWNHQLALAKINQETVGYPRTLLLPSGESFVVWEDHRGGEEDLFAQKLDARGNRLWQYDVQVNDSYHPPDLDRSSIQMLPGPQGGLFILFCDDRYEDHVNGCYLQRLSASGERLWEQDFTVSHGYLDNGIWISAALTPQGDIAVIHSSHSSILVNKFTPDGQPAWESSVTVEQSGEETSPSEVSIGSDAAGGLVAAWGEMPYRGSVHAQRIDLSGNTVWPEAVRVAVLTGPYYYRNMTTSVRADGTAYITWTSMSATEGVAILTQRLNPDGQTQWAEPITVSAESGYQSRYTLDSLVDENGDLLVWWASGPGGANNVMWQKVRPDGSLAFAAEQVLANPIPFADITGMAGSFNQKGAALAAYIQPGKISAQPFFSAGNQVIPTPVVVNEQIGEAIPSALRVAASSDGSTWSVWLDTRTGVGEPKFFAQRFNAAGERQFAIEPAFDPGNLSDARIPRALVAVDAQNNGLVAWEHWIENRREVRVQKLAPNGTFLWPAYQTVRSVTDDDLSLFDIKADASSRIYLLWGRGQRVNAQKLDSSGSRLWGNGVSVHINIPPAGWTIGRGAAALDIGPNGALNAVWAQTLDRVVDDEEQTVRTIYAQSLNASGQPLWPADTQVNVTGPRQFYPDFVRIGTDAAGASSVVWYQNGQYWLQKISSGGERLFAQDKRLQPGGALFVAESGTFDIEPQGNASYVIWPENPGGGVRVQRMDSDGSFLWLDDITANSQPAQADQWFDQMAVSAGSTSASICWDTSLRTRSRHYNCNRVSSAGSRIWAQDQSIIGANRFYQPAGFAQSKRLNYIGTGGVRSVQLDADFALNNGSLAFFLTNDGGKTWQPVTPGARHTFAAPGDDLRWRVEFQQQANLRQTPIIHSLTITYDVETFSVPMMMYLPYVRR